MKLPAYLHVRVHVGQLHRSAEARVWSTVDPIPHPSDGKFVPVTTLVRMPELDEGFIFKLVGVFFTSRGNAGLAAREEGHLCQLRGSKAGQCELIDRI